MRFVSFMGIREWMQRVRGTLWSGRRDDDLEEELRLHLELAAADERRRGASPSAASRAAAVDLGGVAQSMDALRDQRGLPWLADLAQDVRYACRVPRHNLLTIATLALGIGATTTLFSVVYGVLMKPLPWPNGDRLVLLSETRGGHVPRFGAFTNVAYLAWRNGPATIDAIAAWSESRAVLSGAGEPDRIRVTSATASLFGVLGAQPLVGSFFEEPDETTPVVVLSEGLWAERFGSDPRVLGRMVHLDGRAHTVVGVIADQYAYPDRQTRAFVPMRVRPPVGNSLTMFSAIARLAPGRTASQASAEGTARGRSAPDTGMTAMAIFGGNGPIEIAARPLGEALGADVRLPLVVLMAAVALLLVTATANVASLQLVRAAARRREMSIRIALGARMGRLSRQLLVESLLVGSIGGSLGLGIAWWLQRAVPWLLPADFPRLRDLGVDWAVAAFALAVTVGTSVALGLLPVLQVRALNPVEGLSHDGRAPRGWRGRTGRVRAAIMVGQVAIACVLLVGASLLGRSFVGLVRADRGFDAAHAISARLSMPAALYPTPERRADFVDRLLSRLAAMPDMTVPAFTSEPPTSAGGSTAAFTMTSALVEGGSARVQASPRIVSPGYFAAIGQRVVFGRTFTHDDTASSQPVVVVNAAFARQYLGPTPLGAVIPIAGYQAAGGATESTVIGVVGDVRYGIAADQSMPEMYYSYRQMAGLPTQTVTLVARTAGEPAASAGTLRAVVREADDRLVADAIMPLEERVLSTLARPRLYAVLLGAFGAAALAIAAAGLFGLLSYAVSERSRELAVRSALGAGQSAILRLVIRQGLVVMLAGLGLGVPAAAVLVRVLSTQLYGVTAHDAATFVAVPALLLVVGGVACLLPARRASRLDPLRVLRGG